MVGLITLRRESLGRFARFQVPFSRHLFSFAPFRWWRGTCQRREFSSDQGRSQIRADCKKCVDVSGFTSLGTSSLFLRDRCVLNNRLRPCNTRGGRWQFANSRPLTANLKAKGRFFTSMPPDSHRPEPGHPFQHEPSSKQSNGRVGRRATQRVAIAPAIVDQRQTESG